MTADDGRKYPAESALTVDRIISNVNNCGFRSTVSQLCKKDVMLLMEKWDKDHIALRLMRTDLTIKERENLENLRAEILSELRKVTAPVAELMTHMAISSRNAVKNGKLTIEEIISSNPLQSFIMDLYAPLTDESPCECCSCCEDQLSLDMSEGCCGFNQEENPVGGGCVIDFPESKRMYFTGMPETGCSMDDPSPEFEKEFERRRMNIPDDEFDVSSTLLELSQKLTDIMNGVEIINANFSFRIPEIERIVRVSISVEEE